MSHTPRIISLIFERSLSRHISISVKTTSLPQPCLWQYLESLKMNSIFSIIQSVPSALIYLFMAARLMQILVSCASLFLWIHVTSQSWSPLCAEGCTLPHNPSLLQPTQVRDVKGGAVAQKLQHWGKDKSSSHTQWQHHATAPARTQRPSKTGVTALQSK